MDRTNDYGSLDRGSTPLECTKIKNMLKESKHYSKNGYNFTVQKIGKVSHLIIVDSNLYPDEDSRSQEIWRRYGLLIPINNTRDLRKIGKLFDL